MRSHQSTWIDQFEDPGDEFSGITLSGTILSWLKSSGNYSTIKDDISYLGKSYIHFKDTLAPKYNSGHNVIMLIGSEMIDISQGDSNSKKETKTGQLKKGKLTKKAQTAMPNHYVPYEGEFKEIGQKVSFKIWTWGDKITIQIAKADFSRLYYGGIYAK